MNAIEKKHLTIFESNPNYGLDKCISHATITKDTAVGFAEWIRENQYEEWDVDGELRWSIEFGVNFYTTSELYDIYVKSLEG